MLAWAQRLQQYRNHLDEFINAQPITDIWYLHFTQSGHPKVNTKLRTWTCPNGNLDTFVSVGTSSGWCYVYPQTNIAYLIRAYTDQTAQFIINTTEENTGQHFDGSIVGIANFGDHLTIGIGPRRPERIVMLTHYTMYSDIVFPDVKYEREEFRCNAFLDDNPDGITSQSSCIAEPHITFKQRYASTPFVTNIITHLSRLVLGVQSAGAPYINILGKRHRVQVGSKGGSFITLHDGRKKYLPKQIKLQKGGAPLQYKDVRFTPDFVGFIGRKFVNPVYAVRSGLDSVIVLFDETSQLGPNANKYLVFLFDFEEFYRQIFYVDAITAMMAYYAEIHPQTATPQELSAGQTITTIAEQAVARLIPVGAG